MDNEATYQLPTTEPDPRVQLAYERTFLAYERTRIAWGANSGSWQRVPGSRRCWNCTTRIFGWRNKPPLHGWSAMAGQMLLSY